MTAIENKRGKQKYKKKEEGREEVNRSSLIIFLFFCISKNRAVISAICQSPTLK
jgi:hypothetical protein